MIFDSLTLSAIITVAAITVFLLSARSPSKCHNEQQVTEKKQRSS